ncbi:MAG: histidine kinase [Gemmatimonadales bacterium]|nr:histidine kinase [Gemmatimonadales bacterium]
MKRDSIRPWLLVSAIWIAPGFLAALDAWVQGRMGNRPPIGLRTVVWEIGDWLVLGLLAPGVLAFTRRFPLSRAHLGSRIAAHLGAALVSSMLWSLGGTVLRWFLFHDPYWASGKGVLSWIFITLPFGVLVYFAMVGVAHAVGYFAEARERETHAARLSAQLAEARLGALRMQLNPHFLFNSLNAITVLVRDQNTKAASRMLELLGDVLRQVLRSDGPHEIPLRDEFAFLTQYLAVEQVRFSDRLRPTVDLDPAVSLALVPSFILQPLVENALRHGVAKRTDAGVVRIMARRVAEELVLTVEDDGPGIDPGVSEEGPGVGLANTRERLATLYGDRGTLLLAPRPGGGVAATVRLPYHEAPAVRVTPDA